MRFRSYLLTTSKDSYRGRCPLDPELIVDMHAALRTSNKGPLLSYQDLALFLELAHNRPNAGWAQNRLEEVVGYIMDDINNVNNTHDQPLDSTASKGED